jgi:hypothetical protein
MCFAALFDLLECKRRLMRLSNCFSYVLAAALVLPAGLQAADHTCNPGVPTPESYTHDFSKEADQLLTNIRTQAYAVKEDADGLGILSRFNDVSWERDSGRLARVREYVNAMGEDLCRLDQIRRVALPWQRQEIDRITPSVIELANSTQSAIKLLDHHEQNFWATNLPNDMDAIFNEANRIHNTTLREEQYAKGPSGSSPSSTSTGM